ncbi:MAG TPA: type IV pilus assembly protein PilM [Candidatus Saccharimonadales bacterium]|jgi:type IV pilus assembly protein PilM
MNILSGVSDFFGLNIGTTAVRLVQLKGSGPNKSLVRYAYVPIDSKIAQSDAKADQQKLAEVIADLISKSQVSTKNVAVGIPAQRVFTTVVDIDRLPKNELAKSIKFQVDSLIPTPINESKFDWELLGDSPQDKTKVEILLSSVTNAFVEKYLDMLESIGLNVIAFEPDTMALCRSLIAPGTLAPQVVINIDSKSTDLAIIMNDAPRLTRSIPTGNEAIIRTGAQNLNVDEKQAEQLIFKFGLGKDKLEGQVHQAIIGTVDTIVNEIEKSIKFFSTRYTDAKIDRIIVTGAASTLPEFPVYLANKFGLNVEIGNSWRNIVYDPSRQNELMTVSNHFGVAAGLAERNND